LGVADGAQQNDVSPLKVTLVKEAVAVGPQRENGDAYPAIVLVGCFGERLENLAHYILGVCKLTLLWHCPSPFNFQSHRHGWVVRPSGEKVGTGLGGQSPVKSLGDPDTHKGIT